MSDAAVEIEGVDDAFLMSNAQLGMLYHSEAEPGSGVYVGVVAATLPDDIDIDQFKAAWDHVATRHDTLRSFFVWQGVDDPMQVVNSEVDLVWEDLGDAVAEYNGQPAIEAIEAVRRQQLDLSTAPPMRFLLGRLTSGARVFFWVCHHAFADDWSQYLVLEEVQTTYRQLVLGQALPDEQSAPLGAFSDWLADRDEAADEAFWLDTFAGYSGGARLQLGGTADQSSDSVHSRIDVELSEVDSSNLRAAAQKNRVTLAAVTTAVWSLVQHRINGQDDFAYGIATTLRPPEVEGIDQMVGNFVTTMPARFDANHVSNLSDLVTNVQTFMQEAQARSGISLPRLQELLGLPTNTTMFDSIFSFDGIKSLKTDAFAGEGEAGSHSPLFHDLSMHFKSDFPLAVIVLPEDKIGLRAIFDPRVHNTSGIKRLLNAFRAALAAVASHFDKPLAELPLMTEDELQEAKVGMVSTAAVPEIGRIAECVRAKATEHPEKPALVSSSGALSYSDFVARSEQVARDLKAEGFGKGDRIGLYMDRSIDVPVAMLGCLMAGVAYVPFDAAFPQARLERMVQSADLSAILTSKAHMGRLTGAGRPLIDIAKIGKASGVSALPSVDANDVAYVMFTSGSTGTPKGVVVSHANLEASTAARLAWYDQHPDAYLLLSSHAFDSSVAGIYWTLVSGGTLHVASEDEVHDVMALASLFEAGNISHTLCLPSLYQLMVETQAASLSSLSTVIVAGEEALPDLLRAHEEHNNSANLYNEYGPTEATVWCAVAPLKGVNPGAPIPIGAPVPGSELHIRDSSGRPVPNGMSGELWVGGLGVAQGYFGLTDETGLSFVADPMEPSKRLYRTGDLVRQDEDGQLLYLGRIDGQVKIRGYRVELSEVEAVIKARPDVRQAAVTSFGSGAKAKLVAYVVNQDDAVLNPVDLAKYCGSSLPDYMVPAQFVPLTKIPRTPNGKTDRKALPEPADNRSSADFVPPTNHTEAVLAERWRQALWLDKPVGIKDDFHDLGGHSLLAMRLVNEIEKAFDVRIPLSELGKVTTVADQAALITRVKREHPEQSATRAQTGTVPEILVGLDEDEERKLATLTASWDAPFAQEGGRIHILNANGAKPPLFFVFLNEYSFVQLAENLGPDQPVFGLRGANIVVPASGEDIFHDNMRRAAITYLPEVMELADGRPIMLGGYCMGGTTAMYLASFLTALDQQVSTVIVMEKTPPITYRGHVDIIFSRDSFLNPYRNFDRPELAWSRRYGTHSFQFVDGDYGDVFEPHNIADLTRTIGACLDRANDRAPVALPKNGQVISWGEVALPTTLAPGAHIDLEVRFTNGGAWDWHPTESSGIHLRADWVPMDGTDQNLKAAYTPLTKIVRSGELSGVTAHLVAPATQGAYRLEIDMVEEGRARFQQLGNEPLVLATVVEGAPDTSEATVSRTLNGTEEWMEEAADFGARTRAVLRRDAGKSGAELDGPIERVGTETIGVLREIGLRHAQNGDAKKAVRSLRAAHTADPHDTGLLVDLARVEMDRGRLFASYRHLRTARNLGSTDAKLFLKTHFRPISLYRAARRKLSARKSMVPKKKVPSK